MIILKVERCDNSCLYEFEYEGKKGIFMDSSRNNEKCYEIAYDVSAWGGAKFWYQLDTKTNHKASNFLSIEEEVLLVTALEEAVKSSK